MNIQINVKKWDNGNTSYSWTWKTKPVGKKPLCAAFINVIFAGCRPPEKSQWIWIGDGDWTAGASMTKNQKVLPFATIFRWEPAVFIDSDTIESQTPTDTTVDNSHNEDDLPF